LLGTAQRPDYPASKRLCYKEHFRLRRFEPFEQFEITEEVGLNKSSTT
jgi:hypothetical protein